MAVLLPLRGVAAVAMLCHGAGAVAAAAVSAGHDPHDQHGHHGGHGAEENAAEAAQEAAPGATAADGTPKNGQPPPQKSSCLACASGCCLTPLASAPPAFTGPRLTNTAVFPAPSAPAPAFLSGGQDRPPRTI